MLNETLSPSTRWSASTMSVFLSPSGMSLTDAFSIDQDKFFAEWFKTLWGNSNSLVHNPQHPSPASRLPLIAPCPLRGAAIPALAAAPPE